MAKVDLKMPLDYARFVAKTATSSAFINWRNKYYISIRFQIGPLTFQPGY